MDGNAKVFVDVDISDHITYNGFSGRILIGADVL
jgi:hypothetical protein